MSSQLANIKIQSNYYIRYKCKCYCILTKVNVSVCSYLVLPSTYVAIVGTLASNVLAKIFVLAWHRDECVGYYMDFIT